MHDQVLLKRNSYGQASAMRVGPGGLPRLRPAGGAAQPAVLSGWQPSVLTTIWSEKQACAAVFVVLLGVGVIFGALLVPQYRAKSLIMVEPHQARLVEQSTVLEPLRIDTELLQTEAQLIQSQSTLEAVASALQLGDDPEFGGGTQLGPGRLARFRQIVTDFLFDLTGYPAKRVANLPSVHLQDAPVTTIAATRLAGHVKASPVGKTYLIAISATSWDPAKAAIIANSIAEHYIADRMSSRVEISEAASAAIHARLTDLAERLRQGEMALAEFRAKSGFVDTLSASGTSAPILQQELSATSSQLNDARS